MTENLYPLTFQPVYRDYVWGGRHLQELGRELPPGIVAEIWDISGHPKAPTIVDVGPMKGRALTELVNDLGLDLVGRRNQDALARGRFPLLVKLLDANQDLSVQVHPPDAYARQHEPNENGKSEMWYILRAEPDARIIYGLQPGATREALRLALERGGLETQLHYLSVRAGDAIFIPAGAVHALLSGIIAAEIQQTSDATYRIYDWDRVGSDGKRRPLHIDKALDVIDFGLVSPGPSQPELLEQGPGMRRELITRSPYFNVERWHLEAGAEYRGTCEGETFEIWGCVEGQSVIGWAAGALPLVAVRFTLLPAAMGDYAIQASTPVTLLRAYVG